MKSPKWLKKKEIHSTAVTFPGIKLNTILPLSLWRFFHSQENKVVCKQYKMLLVQNLSSVLIPCQCHIFTVITLSSVDGV